MSVSVSVFMYLCVHAPVCEHAGGLGVQHLALVARDPLSILGERDHFHARWQPGGLRTIIHVHHLRRACEDSCSGRSGGVVVGVVVWWSEWWCGG